ncbi:hypothetical protein ACWG0P_07185 [Amedibacillus sp. YH-ame6]
MKDEKKDIISKIKELAYENVNKKLEEERKATEKKINEDIDKVEKVLSYIKNKLIYKEVKGINGWNTVGYVLVDEEIFFNDYNDEKDNTYRKGIVFNKERRRHDSLLSVNGNHYYDIRNIIENYKSNFEDHERRLDRLNENFREIEEQGKLLLQQENNIKKLIEEYKKVDIQEIEVEEF